MSIGKLNAENAVWPLIMHAVHPLPVPYVSLAAGAERPAGRGGVWQERLPLADCAERELAPYELRGVGVGVMRRVRNGRTGWKGDTATRGGSQATVHGRLACPGRARRGLGVTT